MIAAVNKQRQRDGVAQNPSAVVSLCRNAIEALTATHQGKTHCWVDNAPLPEGAQPWGWRLHDGKIARRQVLVAMHGDTRFVMVFWGLKKAMAKRC